MKWIDDLAKKITVLSGKQGTDTGDIIGLVSSIVIFGVIAFLAITVVSIVTGISTATLWTLAMIVSISYTVWQHFGR